MLEKYLHKKKPYYMLTVPGLLERYDRGKIASSFGEALFSFIQLCVGINEKKVYIYTHAKLIGTNSSKIMQLKCPLSICQCINTNNANKARVEA